MLGVKNGLSEKIEARYDGEDFVFEPGITRALSEQAARHIFGYGEKDKKRALLRLGWIPNGAQIEGAIEKLGKIQFLAVEEPKFKDEPASELPRKVADGDKPENRDLSPAEQELAKKLAHQDGKAKQFGKS